MILENYAHFFLLLFHDILTSLYVRGKEIRHIFHLKSYPFTSIQALMVIFIAYVWGHIQRFQFQIVFEFFLQHYLAPVDILLPVLFVQKIEKCMRRRRKRKRIVIFILIGYKRLNILNYLHQVSHSDENSLCCMQENFVINKRFFYNTKKGKLEGEKT